MILKDIQNILREDLNMVYAVFPMEEPDEKGWVAHMPQEFATYEEAEAYKKEVEACGVEAIIEEGSGELV